MYIYYAQALLMTNSVCPSTAGIALAFKINKVRPQLSQITLLTETKGLPGYRFRARAFLILSV